MYSQNPDVPAYLKRDYQNGKLSYEEFSRKAEEALDYLYYQELADEHARQDALEADMRA